MGDKDLTSGDSLAFLSGKLLLLVSLGGTLRTVSLPVCTHSVHAHHKGVLFQPTGRPENDKFEW